MTTVEMTVEERTAEVLQRAHDYIEINGFDIESYSGVGFESPRCYIGTIRTAAGIDPAPADGDAAAGDGLELKLALRTLDDLVREELDQHHLNEVFDNFGEKTGYGTTVGRFIEQFGFQVQREAIDQGLDHDECIEFEKDRALQLLRQALTKIYG